jgi:RNA polymerase sigma-70 factor (ECF subfamily)
MPERSISQDMVPPDSDPTDDAQLVARTRDGDDDAYADLVGRHQQRVYRVAYRITGSHEEALDVAQETFLKAYRKLGSWKPRAPFGAWLARLAVNQAIDHRRRIARHADERTVGLDAAPPATAGSATAGDAYAARREIDERIGSALTELSPAQRTAFVLRHYEGMAVAEIAPVLGCSVGSVKVHLFRAMRRLRVLLHDLESEMKP